MGVYLSPYYDEMQFELAAAYPKIKFISQCQNESVHVVQGMIRIKTMRYW